MSQSGNHKTPALLGRLLSLDKGNASYHQPEYADSERSARDRYPYRGVLGWPNESSA